MLIFQRRIIDMECVQLEQIVLLEPVPEMDKEWSNMSEIEQEAINYEESKLYYLDEKKYLKELEIHRDKLAEHMKNCRNNACKEVLSNWKEDHELNKYVM